jgi:hypothetical protein
VCLMVSNHPVQIFERQSFAEKAADAEFAPDCRSYSIMEIKRPT